MIAAAARATPFAGVFSRFLFFDPDRIDAHLLDAHAKKPIRRSRRGPGDFPVGVTLTTQAYRSGR